MKLQDKKMRKHSIIDGDVPDCTNMPKEESLNHVREENCTDLFLYVYYHPLSLLTVLNSTAKLLLHDSRL